MKRKSAKSAAAEEEVVFPPGCPPLMEGQGNNEMIRRLKLLTAGLQQMENDELKTFEPLAHFLAQPLFMQHSSRELRVLTACCIADLFRLFAPETPYGDPAVLKSVLSFVIRCSRGLENPKDALFSRSFYLLENLSVVKSMNLLLELPEKDCTDLMCIVIKTFFSVLASDIEDSRVPSLMLDVVMPLLHDVDTISNKVFDAIFVNLLQPHKSQKRLAYKLARDILQRGQLALETHIQMYFSHAIAGGKPEGGELNHLQVYSVLGELYDIVPDVALNILPQLEDKITAEDSKERTIVIRTLLSLFSSKSCNLAEELPSLFNALMNRFLDSDKDIRARCVDSCKDLLIHHPALRGQVSVALARRALDSDETVRLQVITVITSVAKTDLAAVNEQLLECVKGRASDKKFSIRKAALRSLACLYRDIALQESTPASDRHSLSWIKNLVLHSYRKEYLEDVVLCEKLLCNCLVPYKEDTERRMSILLDLFVTVDEFSVQAFNQVMKEQSNMRVLVQKLVALKEMGGEVENKTKSQLIKQLAGKLPENQHAVSESQSFYEYLGKDTRLQKLFNVLTQLKGTRKEIDATVKEILTRTSEKGCPQAAQRTAKIVLERASPLLVDKESIIHLLKLVSRVVVEENPDGFTNIPENVLVERCLKLTLILACSFTRMFMYADVVGYITAFLRSPYRLAREYAARMFAHFGQLQFAENLDLEKEILPELKQLACRGTRRQAKCSVRGIGALCANYETIFQQIFKGLSNCMTIDNEMCVTAMESMGAMIRMSVSEEPTDKSNLNESTTPEKTQLATDMKRLIATVIVKDIILNNQEHEFTSEECWVEYENLSHFCKAKIAGVRFVARFLVGIRSNEDDVGSKTIKLLTSIVESKGDIRKKGMIRDAEMAHLRVEAGCALLKLAKYSIYHRIISPDQFSVLATLIHDDCAEVRLKFARKLSSALVSPRLPLRYLSIFTLAPFTQPSASKAVQDYRKLARNAIDSAVLCRRKWMKLMTYCQEHPWMFLPEYSVMQAVYLLAHTTKFNKWSDMNAIQLLRDCFWFLMESLVGKHNNMSGNVQLVYKLLQDIKQMEDKLKPNNKAMQQKLWIVCDLGILLLTYRVSNYNLQQLPKSTTIDKSLYQPAKEFEKKSNTAVYIPIELVEQEKKNHVKKPSNKIRKPEENKTSVNETTANVSADSEPSISDSTLPPDTPPPLANETGRGGRRKGRVTKTAEATVPPKTPTPTVNGTGRGKKRKGPETKAMPSPKRTTRQSNGKKEKSDIEESDSDDEPLKFLRSPSKQPMTSTPAVDLSGGQRRSRRRINHK